MRNQAGVRAIHFAFSIALTLLLPLAHPALAQGTKVFTVDRASNLLREINPATGATVASIPITVTTGSPPQTVRGATGLATDPTTSKLYALIEFTAPVPSSPQTRHLATIDPITGVATVIGSALTRSYADITFATNGTLYAVTGDGSNNPSTLFTINKSTGAASAVAAFGNGDDGEVIAFNSGNNLIYHMSGKNETGAIPPTTMVLETFNPASATTPVINVPIVTSIPISEATTMVYEGGGRFLWVDILNSGFPPVASRLLTMTTGGVPALRGSLNYAATGIAIVNVFTLNVEVVHAAGASGTVASVPLGVTCGSPTLQCPTPFVGGTQVTLTATPGPNSGFVGWEGACTGVGSCVVDMNADRAVRARFTSTLRTLTVTRTGAGTVTSSPPGTPVLDCGTSCTATFADGTPVTLTASPATGSTFNQWAGCTAAGLQCTVSMTQDRQVSAAFVASHSLSVTKAGTGTGTVTSSPAGINCGTVCDALFLPNNPVFLTATPASGSIFASWSGGGCSGTIPNCSVMMTGPQTVTATFTATAIPTGDFSIDIEPISARVVLREDESQVVDVLVTVTGTGGISGTIAVACVESTLPLDANCTNPPASPVVLTPNSSGNSVGTTTVKINIPWRRNPDPASGGPLGNPLLPLVATFLTLLAAAAAVAPRVRRRVKLSTAMAAGGLALIAIAAVTSACGDAVETVIEIERDYSVIIRATAGQSPQAIEKTKTLSLTVLTINEN